MIPTIWPVKLMFLTISPIAYRAVHKKIMIVFQTVTVFMEKTWLTVHVKKTVPEVVHVQTLIVQSQHRLQQQRGQQQLSFGFN